jgi:homoserine dehydrogenase
VTTADGAVQDVYGKGAGRWPTAAAVFADVMDLQRTLAAAAQAEPHQAERDNLPGLMSSRA